MAQNVTIAGNQYPDVPSILVPKTGGGGNAIFADPSVVTAVAADVASGKYFLDSSGALTQGTASGGGGASNFVSGEFVTQSASGAQSVTIPYTGNGYPIMAYIVIKGGAYVSGTTWYDAVDRYAVGVWAMSKSDMDTIPTYTSSTTDKCVTFSIYKNSTTSATNYTRAFGMDTFTFSSSSAIGAVVSCVRFHSKTSMSVYVKSTSYGFLPSQDYQYFILYSS